MRSRAGDIPARLWQPLSIGALCVLLLEICSKGFAISFVPSVADIVSALASRVAAFRLGFDVAASLGRLLAGLVPAIVTVVPIALLIGRVPVLRQSLRPILDFLRAIPVTALFPLFLLLLGMGNPSKVAMCFWTCALILGIAGIDAAEAVDQTRLRVLRRLGASHAFLLWNVLLPETLPPLLSAIRVSLGAGLVIVLASEMFSGTRYGLGAWAYVALVRGDVAGLWASILLAGIVAIILNYGTSLLERNVVFWKCIGGDHREVC